MLLATKPLRNQFRISAAKPVGRTAKNASRAMSRRRWTTVRCRLVDFGQHGMARFALHTCKFFGAGKYLGVTVWQVSEVNCGLRVSMELTQEDAIYHADVALAVRSRGALDRAIRRGIHKCGRANLYRRARRS